ncbi:hypothetical protein [Paenibacillus sp. GP183]|jgi:hypothetical protein|uniref:hypothetical protein n=1 Tax=Paenibacillus sp. GP183 TaxID=1882751 RepID=UPI0008944138|nr:hypothetical protein [Paenibacillus sp. GP183]SED08288.1 hypothetical protein SAMN05443246_5627 [Paenibacillus sp. GP183]
MNPNQHPASHWISTKIQESAWDEIWMRPVHILAEEQVSLAHEEFEMIINDLLKMPKSTPILAEGIALIPELVAKLLLDKKRAIWLVPSKDFQIKHYSMRTWINDILRDCLDPAKAFKNWMAKDHMYAETVVEQADRNNLMVIKVDDEQSIEENTKNIAEHFGLS